MLLVLFLAGIASASLSEDFNKNPDLYYRILFKHADKTFKALGLILGFFILVEDEMKNQHQFSSNCLRLKHSKVLFE